MAKDGCTGSMFTCVQAIKNLMRNYNAKGEWVEPTTGLTGLLVTDETGDSYKRMIDIPESSKDKMFVYVKNNYIEKMEWRTEQEKRKFIWICINKWTRMIGCRQVGHWASTVRRIRKRLYLRLRKLLRHGHMVKPYPQVSWRVSQGSFILYTWRNEILCDVNEYSNVSKPPFYRLRATSDSNTLEPPQTQDIVMEP